MNENIKLEGLALEIAEKWAEYRVEASTKGRELKDFDRRMKMHLVIGVAGLEIAEDIVEAAIELSEIKIKASEWARQRREAISDGLPMAYYDPCMRRGIFFGNLDEEKTDEIFRLAVKLSERKDLQ